MLKVKWAHLGAWTWEWLIKGGKKSEYWTGKVRSMGLFFEEFWTYLWGLWIWWVACALAQMSYTDKSAQILIPSWGLLSKLYRSAAPAHFGRSSLCTAESTVGPVGPRSKLLMWGNCELNLTTGCMHREGLNKHTPVRGQAICLEI